MGPILFVFSLGLLHANGQEDGDAISALQKSADYDVKSMKSEAVQTFPSHADSRYKVHPGRYMVEGSDILQADMNLTRASWLCNKIATCVGFTFEGSSVDGEGSDEEDHKVHRVHFKSKFETFAGDWTSYEKLSPGAGVQKSQDITVPIPVPRELRQGSSSDPSAQTQTISFTCLTETYLGKGNDLQAVRMLPQLAPDFCARLQYGNRPCVGWTWHGANGTMASQEVLGSPFFDETKIVYFKHRQRPGSSARWASCITVDGQGGGLGQGGSANLIAKTETQSRPTSLKAVTEQEAGSRPTSLKAAALSQKEAGPGMEPSYQHGQPGHVFIPPDVFPETQSQNQVNTTIVNTVDEFGEGSFGLPPLTLEKNDWDELAKYIRRNPKKSKIEQCIGSSIHDPHWRLADDGIGLCLDENQVTPCAYDCVYTPLCGGEDTHYGLYVKCRNEALEACHTNGFDGVACSKEDESKDRHIHCAGEARANHHHQIHLVGHDSESNFYFCDANYPRVHCERSRRCNNQCTDDGNLDPAIECKANSFDPACQFEACGQRNAKLGHQHDPATCGSQLTECEKERLKAAAAAAAQ